MRIIAKALSHHYGNKKISKVMRTIWFDLLSASKLKQTMISFKFTLKSIKNDSKISKYAPINRIESNVLRDLEKVNNKYSGRKINYDLIFGTKMSESPRISKFVGKKQQDMMNKANQILRKEQGTSYKYNSRRFFKSKKDKERVLREKSKEKLSSGGPRVMRKRRKSSNIKLIQDDETIQMFQDFEENLLNCKGKDDFLQKILCLAEQKCDAVQIDYLVKRFTEVYIYGREKMLNKKERVNLKYELKKVVKYINELLEIEDPVKIPLNFYDTLRKYFHYLCFVLSLMRYISESCAERFKEELGLKNTCYPFQVLDVEIFVERIQWDKLKEKFVGCLKKIKEFCDENKIQTNHRGFYQTLGSTAATNLELGSINSQIFSNNMGASLFQNSIKNESLVQSEEIFKNMNFGKNGEENKFFPEFDIENFKVDLINYEKLVALIHTTLAISGTAYNDKELENFIKNIKRDTFNTKINHNFAQRRNYLFYNLRYYKRLKPKSLWHDFKLLYPKIEDWERSGLKVIKEQSRANFTVDYVKKSIWVENYCLKNLKKVLDDFNVCGNLQQIALWIGEECLKNEKLKQKNFLEKENNLSIGVVIFTLKLFYGVGIGVPSLINLKKSMIEKYVKSKELKGNIMSCLEFIQENDKKNTKNGKPSLTNFSMKLSPFQDLVISWLNYFNKVHNSHDIFSSFSEMPQTNLKNFKKFVKKNLEEIIKQKCRFETLDFSVDFTTTHNPRKSLQDKLKSMREEEDNMITVKRNLVDKSYVEEEEVREEIKEEIEFIEANFGNEMEIEVPHPSDIYIKFKRFGSIPFDKIGEDFLILLKFCSFYFGIESEKIIQIGQKVERALLTVFQKKLKEREAE